MRGLHYSVGCIEFSAECSSFRVEWWDATCPHWAFIGFRDRAVQSDLSGIG